MIADTSAGFALASAERVLYLENNSSATNAVVSSRVPADRSMEIKVCHSSFHPSAARRIGFPPLNRSNSLSCLTAVFWSIFVHIRLYILRPRLHFTYVKWRYCVL